MRLLLASRSPRRLQLLTWAGYDVRVFVPDVDERNHRGLGPDELATRLATEKAATAPRFDGPVVAADTLVYLDGRFLDKPRDEAEAASHLRALSGREHLVVTGVCVRSGADARVFAVRSGVLFRSLTDGEISRYVESGEPMDKAGAYGIQGMGGWLLAEVRGSWTNVMGLPLEETLKALGELGCRP